MSRDRSRCIVRGHIGSSRSRPRLEVWLARSVGVCFAAVTLSAGSARAAPAIDRQAELWAAGCASCHGMDGKGVGGFPAIGARDASELLSLLLRYRSGDGEPTIMHQHSRGFSESELARIAAVFAGRRRP